MIRKIFYILAVPAIILLLTAKCVDEEGIIDKDIIDVSERISSIDDTIGAGDSMIVVGTQFEDLQRIIFGPIVLTLDDIEFTSTELKFTVPALVPNGENEIVLVFSGYERAFSTIFVSANQTIDYFDPAFAFIGDTVIVYGTNLFVVTSVTVGDVEAEILTQPGELLTFIIPDGAFTGLITLKSPTIVVSSDKEFIVCDNSDELVCFKQVNINGGFEDGSPGVLPTTGDYSEFTGGYWYIPYPGTRQIAEIVRNEDVPDNKYPGLDSLSLKINIISEWLNSTSFTDNWQVQVVNDPMVVDSNRYFQFMGKIWSDLTGRQVEINGGVSLPGYQNMGGDTVITLKKGWNDFSFKIWHLEGQDETQIRAIVSYGYLINDGVTFYFDDFRILDIGPRDQ